MRKAFTLIELLIVVAIIAILAAIAVPNFLEAQMRAKISRSVGEMRNMSTAIESYRIDNNKYPSLVAITSTYAKGGGGAINGPSMFYPGIVGISSRYVVLSTPISYITSVFRDPFIDSNTKYALSADNLQPITDYDTYDFADAATVWTGGGLGGTRGASVSSGASWHMVGCGPDRINAFGGGPTTYTNAVKQAGVDYDATNGTISRGDLVRIGGGPGPIGTIKPSIDRISNKYN